jgi:hypothetical protein
MNYRLKVDPYARIELEDHIEWYNMKQAGLGNRLFNNIKEAFSRIEQNPFGYALRYKNTRAIPLKKFPFTIHYVIDEENKTIGILSFFKTHQNPEKWKRRTK